MKINDKNGIGRIQVKTLELPDFVKRASGTYTYSGKVLIDYHREDDPDIKDYIHIAVMNDDSSGFGDIFTGIIPIHQKANGVRYMPFQDNKRVLLGDYVLECFPNIDQCTKAELVPLHYPWHIQDNANVFMSWSEVIISPDNEHVCWTALMNGMNGAVNAIGRLIREESCYVITDAQVISDNDSFGPDPQNPGYVLVKPKRGGEVKQFVRGGTAISLAGAGDAALTDSVVQDLLSEEIIQITKLPGYEETTIFSPDEKLGLVMSTRGSEETNCAILGLLPRPNGMLVTMRLINCVYLYAVAGVRHYRNGNVGPALIEIDKSMADGDYEGVVLCDPENKWVYCSPMSWHPGNKKAMWQEVLRGTSKRRLRIVELLDYEPQSIVPVRKTPTYIPYGKDSADSIWTAPEKEATIHIAGKVAGVLAHKQDSLSAMSEYKQYSDDGKNYFNGYERMSRSNGEVVYEADLIMAGAETGEMKCKLTFSELGFTSPTRLIKEKSSGYAKYNGKTFTVDNMSE